MNKINSLTLVVSLSITSLFSCTKEMPIEVAPHMSQSSEYMTVQPDLSLSYVEGRHSSFVFDEIYFSGDAGLDGTRRVFNDQYFTICNNSPETLYADGLCIGISAGYTYLPSQSVRKYFPGDIVASQIYSIPGTGRDVPVAPGKSLVIARSARNHRAESPEPSNFVYNPDLTGADFEIYVPDEYSVTKDNPRVPDLVIHHTAFQAFQWLFDGGTPIFLFRTNDIQGLLSDGRVTYQNPMWTNYAPDRLKFLVGIKVPQSLIIDAVETRLAKGAPFKTLFVRSVAQSPTFTLPDKRPQLQGGGLQGFFLQRKRITASDGRIVKKDTNKSGEDFVLTRHGQKSYPAR